VRPHRWQPIRLPHPWDSPGKNTGVGCHFLLQCMKVKGESEVTQSCPTLSDPMDCSLPGFSIHGILQARVLEWGAIAFSDSILYIPLFIVSQKSHLHTLVSISSMLRSCSNLAARFRHPSWKIERAFFFFFLVFILPDISPVFDSQPSPLSLNIHWKDWCCCWSSNTLATWYEEQTHWKRPWC